MGISVLTLHDIDNVLGLTELVIRYYVPINQIPYSYIIILSFHSFLVFPHRYSVTLLSESVSTPVPRKLQVWITIL